ncbi:MAG: gamma-glutamylcyclotransferase family protein [Bacteroidota bacterium]
MINDLLFVYGTLLLSDNEHAAYLRNNASFYHHGKLNGRLFDVGSYPAVILNDADNYPITGSIYRLNNPEALKLLDEYEGITADENEDDWYTRELVSVETVSGSLNCWVYLYNLPVDGLTEIISGDYLGYLKQK